jgi:FkbM family methyltransferase
MKQKIRRFIQKILYGYEVNTYYFSQSGEDATLHAIFNKMISNGEKGFFIDIGSYHPYKQSNTYFLYLNKWRGINIDPRPGSMKLFNHLRPNDINLEIGIGKVETTLTYYFIDDDSKMNSFSKDYLSSINALKYVTKEIPIKVFTLESVLDKHVKHGQAIHLMNIDAEGLDIDILTSNNWEKYKPYVLVIELNCETIEDLLSNESVVFLKNIGYNMVFKNIIVRGVASVIFIHSSFDY